MDEREIILRSIENREIRLKKCHFHQDNDYELWHIEYEYKKQSYVFYVDIYEISSEIHVKWEGIDLKKDKEKRLILSKILFKLVKSIEESTIYRLKILFENWKVMHDGHKYLIYEPDNFENRKTMDFINENQEIIKNVFKDAIENSKNRAIKREGYWVIKEEDDELLFECFINQGFANIITTVDNEKVVKFRITETIDEYEFELHFKNGMEKLGYNLYYESFENDFYEDDEYDWYEYYTLHYLDGDAESYVRKKIRDQKKQNKKTKKDDNM